MAVEIPVVVDIEGAFKDAAKRVKTAMKPLQDVIDSAPASLFIEVKIGKSKKLLIELFDDANTSVKSFQTALDQVNAKIEKLAAKGGFNLRGKGLSAEEKSLLEAAQLLETQLKGVGNASDAMGRILTMNMKQAEAEIVKYTAQLDKLQKKQNRNRRMNADGTGLAAGLPYQKQIDSVNAKLQQTRKFIAACSVEMEKLGLNTNTVVTSMGATKTYAQKMADEFRRGHDALTRWNAALGTSQSKLGALIKSSITLVALHGAGRFLKNVRNVTAEFEMQRVALGGIIQDTEKAESLFKQIKAAAIKSPFEIKDLVSFTKQLSAYRIETENLFDVTMRLADISAGLGVDMSRLVLAYGQVRAAAVLRGQELRQFTEAGIPLVELLAEKFQKLGREGTTTADVFELISKRAVPFSMIEEIFNDMTNAGGIFYKMQEKQSETLKGQWMKLKDAASIMYDEIGNTSIVHKAMTDMLAVSMRLMQNWKEVGRVLGVAVSALVAYKIALANAKIATNALTLREAASISADELGTVSKSRLAKAILKEEKAKKLAIIVTNKYIRAKKRETIATNMFTKAYYRMIAAFWKNPYAIAIAGVTALLALFVKFIRKSREAAITNEEFQQSLEKYNSAETHANDIDDLCNSYDKLASKTNRTKEEEIKLSRITKELSRLYPQSVTGIDKQTEALNINTDAIRKNNEQARLAAKNALEKDRENAEKELKKLLKKRQSIQNKLDSGKTTFTTGMGVYVKEMGESERKKLGADITDINNKIADLNKTLGQTEDALKKINDAEFIGPLVSPFQGNAWKKQLFGYSTYIEGIGRRVNAFTLLQVQQFADQKEAMNETAKEYKKYADLVEFYEQTLVTATGERRKQTEKELAEAKAYRDMYGQILTDYNAWVLVKNKDDKSYKADPFIETMQNRMKFMQDFKKGYDELGKYLNKGTAFKKQANNMLSRGLSLGLSADEQGKAAESLSEWYQNAIEQAFKKAQKYGAGSNLTEFLSRQITGTGNQAKALRDFQKLIQSLWDAKTDFDVSQMAKNFENAFKKLEEELKHSETARNFYNEILGMTSDQNLATTLSIGVYGDIGSEFKDRIQAQLDDALNDLEWDSFDGFQELVHAFDTQDFDTIMKYIDKFPEETQKRLKEIMSDTQKFNADIAKDLVKALSKAKTYGDKRVEIAEQTAERLRKIESMNVDDEVKEQFRKQNAKQESEDLAKLAYDTFKETPMYVELFANLDRASTSMLRNMRNNLLDLKGEWGKSMPPTELKEMQSRLNEIDQQLATKNPFRALIDSIKEYRKLTSSGMTRADADAFSLSKNQSAEIQKRLLADAQKEYEVARDTYGLDSEITKLAKRKRDDQKDDTDKAIEEANAAQETANAYRSAAQHISDAAKGLETWAGYVSDALGGIESIVDTFSSDEVSETFSIIAGGINNTLGGAAKLAAGIAMGPLGIPTIIAGLGDLIKGIFGTASELRIKRANKQIKTQSRLIEDLEESYEKLNKAMDSSFGNQYVYNLNKMLETLNAEYEAYRKQAAAERSKGKKTDEDALRGYEKSARDTVEKIKELRNEASSFFAGSDLSSAAESFADAWLSAYEEFGDTASAIEERMTDMVQNIVKKAALSGIAQAVMGDWYESLANIQDWNAKTVAEKWKEAMALVDPMVQGMSNFAGAMQAEGISLRNTAGQFTGISRNIAGATEESINGLAAGINTQNFYISHLDANVAAILSIMSGGAHGSSDVPAGVSSTDMMLQYMATLPSIDQNLSELLRKVNSVISPKNATTNTHYIAVK